MSQQSILIDVQVIAPSRGWSAEVEHEREVALFDLLEENSFDLLKTSDQAYTGPYKLTLEVIETRLSFSVTTETDAALMQFMLAMGPFRRIIRDYFAICDSYYEAIRGASPQKIEAIDMGRRGLHNEGSELLRERLSDKIALDHETARRLFTLICALHMSDTRGVR